MPVKVITKFNSFDYSVPRKKRSNSASYHINDFTTNDNLENNQTFHLVEDVPFFVCSLFPAKENNLKYNENIAKSIDMK